MTPKPHLWIFDFDGTISNIVPERDKAVLEPKCERLLTSLAGDDRHVVAIVSSRSLEDLRRRVTIDNVVLAGGSGLEWLLPEGHTLVPNFEATERLAAQRSRAIPAISDLQAINGVEIEDKRWSAAVHFRRVPHEYRDDLSARISALRSRYLLTVHLGPEVAEIHFLREVSKKLGIQTLLKMFGHRFTSRDTVYSGDDQNDAEGMRWILKRKGKVFVVGNGISIPGATAVGYPAALALAIRQFLDSSGESAANEGKKI